MLELRPVEEMTEGELIAEEAVLNKRLRAIWATKRSDWHKVIEGTLLRLTSAFRKILHIMTETEVGVKPPRTDFIIIKEDQRVDLGLDVFKIFRKFNVVEYKSPQDALNERTLRKAAGYAFLMIGTARRERDYPSSEVTVTVIRARRNKKLFKSMMHEGTLVASGTH